MSWLRKTAKRAVSAALNWTALHSALLSVALLGPVLAISLVAFGISQSGPAAQNAQVSSRAYWAEPVTGKIQDRSPLISQDKRVVPNVDVNVAFSGPFGRSDTIPVTMSWEPSARDTTNVWISSDKTVYVDRTGHSVPYDDGHGSRVAWIAWPLVGAFVIWAGISLLGYGIQGRYRWTRRHTLRIAA